MHALKYLNILMTFFPFQTLQCYHMTQLSNGHGHGQRVSSVADCIFLNCCSCFSHPFHPQFHNVVLKMWKYNKVYIFFTSVLISLQWLFHSPHSGLNRPLDQWPPWQSPASLLQAELLFYTQRLNTQTGAPKWHWRSVPGYCPAFYLKSGKKYTFIKISNFDFSVKKPTINLI